MTDPRPIRRFPGVSGTGRRRVALLCLALLPLLAAVPGRAQSTLAPRAGLDGFAKIGAWLPLFVSLENPGDDVAGRIEAEIGQRPSSIRYVKDVRLAAGARQRHLLLPRTDRSLRSVPVRFQGVEADVPIRFLDPGDRLVLAVSDDRSALSFLPMVPLGPPPGGTSPYRQGPSPQSARVHVTHADAAGLFDDSLAYSAVDVIALGSVPLRALGPDQRDALREFVMDGGTLVVGGGSDVARLRDPLLRDLLPVRDAVPQAVESLGALGARYGTAIPGAGAAIARATPLPGARVWVQQGGIPLIVSRSYGSGRALFFAFDYDQAPVRGWSGQIALWQEILSQGGGASVLREAEDPGPIQGYYGPQRPALASALANVRSMDFPSTRTVGLFFLTYLLCLVPLNYLVLRRLDRREYAWVTAPAIVALFCVVALAIGYQTKGRSLILYRLDVFESAPGAHSAAGTSYAGLFSPGHRRYVLEAPPGSGLHESGDAPRNPYGGGGLGGSSAVAGDYTVASGEKTRLEDVLIRMYDMRVFGSRARRDLGGAVTASLRPASSVFEGRIRNGTRQHFEGGVLVLGRRASPVGALPPGGEATVSVRIAAPAAPGGSGGPWPRPPSRPPAGPGVPENERIRAAAVSALQDAALKVANPMEPVLIAWGTTGSSPVRVVGARPRETSVGVYVLHLDAPHLAAGRGLSLPAGMVSGRIAGIGPQSHTSGDGSIYLQGGSVVKEFRVPSGMPVRRLGLHWEGTWTRSARPAAKQLDLSLRDARTGRWVAVPASASGAGGTAAVPDPRRFVEGGSGRVQVRLAAPGEWYVLRRLEISINNPG